MSHRTRLQRLEQRPQPTAGERRQTADFMRGLSLCDLRVLAFGTDRDDGRLQQLAPLTRAQVDARAAWLQQWCVEYLAGDLPA